MKKISFYALISIFVAMIVLFSACTAIPNLIRDFGFYKTAKVNTGNDDINLNKAMVVDACNQDESVCLKDVVLIIGRLDEGTIKSLKNLQGSNNTICFDSPGGNSGTATAIGRLIHENNMNTCMADKYIIKNTGTLHSTRCHSACPFILAMGYERIKVGNNFKIGIHNSGGVLDFCVCSFKYNSPNSIAENQYKEMLKSSNAYHQHLNMLDRSLETDFSDEHMLSPLDIEQFNLFTKNITNR